MTKTSTRSQLFDISRVSQNNYSMQMTPPAGGDGLEKYDGNFDYAAAAHLIRRTTFGAHHQQIKEAVGKGLDAVIEELFADVSLPEEPINYYFEDDPEVPVGSSWVNKPYYDRGDDTQDFQAQLGSRRRSLFAWQMKTLLERQIHIREKMTLFWHNHFVIQSSIVQDANYVYNYSNNLRTNALGNFKDLVGIMTIDPAMLRYLNGNQNNLNAPNENYARELLELFTIGKGDLAGPNDYTTFTEDDVVAAAKVLTGWRDVGYRTSENVDAGARFVPPLHDRSSKQFSHRFQNQTIDNQNENEYLALIDMIFNQDEVSRFICRKFYRWFVYYDINEEVEANIIEPLAQMLRENNYEVAPVLKVLLSSAHFYNIL